ncbi:hypothetical protein [Ureibacillus endophyticus]|uniref:hypothetical protein n=1 Tax=Ureibacillus endophyticus TaxID=1978490 RepID=UPI0011C431CD|nr:hypothetical protein [Lysinibacillus endophyticus]
MDLLNKWYNFTQPRIISLKSLEAVFAPVATLSVQNNSFLTTNKFYLTHPKIISRRSLEAVFAPVANAFGAE